MDGFIRRIIVFSVALCVVSVACAQASLPFASPFDFPLLLSGNFGELRSNHFHSGIDIKTQGVTGKPIKCVADGYIYRAKVQTGGYGLALYVMHDNGYMTVYGHLDRFTDEISKRVRAYQYENETFEADMYFAPGEFPVRRGQLLAYAGNSGYSFGPHLHFEVRDSTGNELYDPMKFFKSHIEDRKPPKALAFALYPKAGSGVVSGGTEPVYKNVVGNVLPDTIDVWGDVSFGVKALDYMNGTNNKYGVAKMELFADGTLLFSSEMSSFSYAENRLINGWIDYDRYSAEGDRFQRLYVLDNVPLRVLSPAVGNGWLRVDSERLYKVSCRLSDGHGNVSLYSFMLRGRKCAVPEAPAEGRLLRWAQDNVVEEDGLYLVIPAKELFEDCRLSLKAVKGNGLSLRYSIDGDVPLWHSAEIELCVPDTVTVDSSRIYLRRVAGKRGVYAGGEYCDGWIKAKIALLGDYELAADTVAPRLVPVREAAWMKRGVVEFRLADNETAIKSFRGTLDGKFVLFKYSSKDSRLLFDLKEEKIRRGTYLMKVVATDMLGNEVVFEKKIRY